MCIRSPPDEAGTIRYFGADFHTIVNGLGPAGPLDYTATGSARGLLLLVIVVLCLLSSAVVANNRGQARAAHYRRKRGVSTAALLTLDGLLLYFLLPV